MAEIKRITSEELAQMKARAEGTSYTSAYIIGDPWKGYEVKNEGNGIVIAETYTCSDAQFIAHAREDVPALIAEVERLRDELITAIKERDEYAKSYSDASWNNYGWRR